MAGAGFDCDVLIAGGGPTGVTLAISPAGTTTVVAGVGDTDILVSFENATGGGGDDRLACERRLRCKRRLPEACD